jgi:hypothetical protein
MSNRKDSGLSMWSIIGIACCALVLIFSGVFLVMKFSGRNSSIGSTHASAQSSSVAGNHKRQGVKNLVMYVDDSVNSVVERDCIEQFAEANGINVEIRKMAVGRAHGYHMNDTCGKNTVFILTGYGSLKNTKNDFPECRSVQYARTNPVMISMLSAEELNATGQSPDAPRKIGIMKNGALEGICSDSNYVLNSNDDVVYFVDGKYIEILKYTDSQLMIDAMKDGMIHMVLFHGCSAPSVVDAIKGFSRGGNVVEIFDKIINHSLLVSNRTANDADYHEFLVKLAEYIRGKQGAMIDALRRKIDADYITIDPASGAGGAAGNGTVGMGAGGAAGAAGNGTVGMGAAGAAGAAGNGTVGMGAAGAAGAAGNGTVGMGAGSPDEDYDEDYDDYDYDEEEEEEEY